MTSLPWTIAQTCCRVPPSLLHRRRTRKNKKSGNAAARRNLIARARELYPGPLDLRRNFGAEFESIKVMGDALDYIGIDENIRCPTTYRPKPRRSRKYPRPRAFKSQPSQKAGFPGLAEANRAPWDEQTVPVDLKSRPNDTSADSSPSTEKPLVCRSHWWKRHQTATEPHRRPHTPWKTRAARQSLDRGTQRHTLTAG